MVVRAVLLAAAMIAGACADDGATDADADPSTTTNPTTTSTTTTTTTATPTTTTTPTTTASPGPAPADLAAALCAGATQDSDHLVVSTELVEISGIGASVAEGGALWAHNDSGDTSRVFGVGVDGTEGGVWELAGVDARDWEDMAIGPGPDAGITYLYLADIGDNSAQREEIVVHRVVEPSDWGAGGTIADVDSFTLTYADGPHDAESFLIDPETGNWYVITKGFGDGLPQVFHTPAPDQPGDPIVLQQVATVDLTALGLLATAADVSPDGSLVAIRTYVGVLVYHRQPGAPLESAFATEPCMPAAAVEAQGEAIAFLGTTGYVTISEGSNPPINVFGVPG